VAEPGKLRLRDGRLVVEALGGRIIAEIEPDDDMAIDTMGIVAAEFVEKVYGVGPTEGRITVSWYQRIGDRGDFIDGTIAEDAPVPPIAGELEAGDDG